MKKTEEGFVLILFLSLLPVFITGMLIIMASINTIQNDLAMKYECRQGGLEGQRLSAPLLASLLKLNSRAVHLRMRRNQALSEIAAATLSKNALALSTATKKLIKVRKQQEELDGLQKQIIKQANLILNSASTKTNLKLYKTASSLSNIFAKFRLTTLISKKTKLAIYPDLPDLAPIYRLEKDFEVAQSLAHEWQFLITTQPPFSYFIPGTFTYKKTCAVTLHKEFSQWHPKVFTGKHSLKSVW